MSDDVKQLVLKMARLNPTWGYDRIQGAVDFTTVEVWTMGGLVTYYLLFVMELSTRRVHLASCTASLGDDFMRQIARNLTDPFDGFLTGSRYVLMDCDSNFSSALPHVASALAVRAEHENPACGTTRATSSEPSRAHARPRFAP